jgi:hypothetical protein
MEDLCLKDFFNPGICRSPYDRGDSGESFYLGCLCSVGPTIQFFAFEAKQTSGRPRHLGHRQDHKLIFRRDLNIKEVL